MLEILYGNMENTYKRKGMYVTGRLHPKIKSHYLLTPLFFFYFSPQNSASQQNGVEAFFSGLKTSSHLLKRMI